MEIIKRDLFDVAIEKKADTTEVDFYFDIEDIKKEKTQVTVCEEDGLKYNIYERLYGRIVIGTDSYFSEIVAFVNPDDVGHLTYHILFVDTPFEKKYQLNTSNSDYPDNGK